MFFIRSIFQRESMPDGVTGLTTGKEVKQMKYSYRTKGTCSQQIDLEINDDVITNVKFYGGCDGNLKAIPILVEGLTVDQIVQKCSGIQCGFKNTSCADQLSKAVLAAQAECAAK